MKYDGIQEKIHQLIVAEQVRQKGQFVDVDIEEYIAKLFDKARFVISAERDVCHGFVAYYCNDEASRTAYITLVLVAPSARKEGLAQSLVSFVLDAVRRKNFSQCLLEVHKANIAALRLYEKLGFSVSEERASKYLLRIGLKP